MFYTVYKITNNENGKIYVGIHRTDNLNDGYMGSGSLIKKAIREEGIDKFRKEYLGIFDNADDMILMETQIVNNTFVLDDDTYNIKTGGVGYFEESYVNYSKLWKNGMTGKHHTEQTKALKSQRMKEFFGRMTEDELREWKAALSKRSRESHNPSITKNFLGRKHSEETKAIMSEKASLRTGDKNSAYGSRWMHKLFGEVKMVPADLVNEHINTGWEFGRSPKRNTPKSCKKTSRKIETKAMIQKTGATNTRVKVTDEEYIAALKSSSSICQALQKLGLAPKGSNYTRAKRLLGYNEDIRLNTNGKPKDL